MADTLEIEESELFDVNEHADVVLVKQSHHMAVLRTTIEDADAYSDDESETGLVDGFDDFDSSTASAGRSALAIAIAEDTAHALEMATSTGGFSEVGSLKRFDPVGGGVKFGSEGDLSLAASAPNNTFGVAMPPPRSITPGPPEYNAAAGYLVSYTSETLHNHLTNSSKTHSLHCKLRDNILEIFINSASYSFFPLIGYVDAYSYSNDAAKGSFFYSNLDGRQGRYIRAPSSFGGSD